MTESLEQKVAGFLRLHGIFAGAGRILVAVSGGADSIALLYVLRTLRDEGSLRAELVCIHVNHQLRGQESDADERFVVEQARRLGLPVVTRTVDVRGYAERRKLSLETAARQLRLAELSKVAREQGCTWIAAGHQKNDNAETVVHRLRRGTGFRGLAGIRPVRQLGDNLRLTRPLLCVTREEIVRYLREHNLAWREDHTNVDLAYTRNFIRHRLLPLLQQESRGSLVEDLSELALSAGVLYDRIREEAARAWLAIAQPGDRDIRIDASRLASLPEPVGVELIRRALVSIGCGERDLTEGHYEHILQLARRQMSGGQISLPDGFLARYASVSIVLMRRVCRAHQRSDQGEVGVHSTPYTLTIPGQARFAGFEIDAKIITRDEIDVAQLSRDKSPFCEYIDWDQVRPLVAVRPRRRGDRFQPLGLSAMKKVGKFLTTARVPRELREQTIIFTDQEKIVWVCPVRIAESVKITESTRRILSLAVRRI